MAAARAPFRTARAPVLVEPRFMMILNLPPRSLLDRPLPGLKASRRDAKALAV
jgi:hypothetical protein